MELLKPSKDKEVLIWGRLRTRTSKQEACVKRFCRHMCVFCLTYVSFIFHTNNWKRVEEEVAKIIQVRIRSRDPQSKGPRHIFVQNFIFMYGVINVDC